MGYTEDMAEYVKGVKDNRVGILNTDLSRSYHYVTGWHDEQDKYRRAVGERRERDRMFDAIFPSAVNVINDVDDQIT